MNAATNDIAQSDAKRNLWPLWAMIGVFAAPVVATWFYFFFPEYLPQTRSNRGELLSPTVPLPDGLGLTGTGPGMGNAPFDTDAIKGSWTLVYLTGDRCDAACIERITQLRQIRTGLGESFNLVQRLLLTPSDSPPIDQTLLADAFEGMHVARLSSAGKARLIDALGEGPAAQGRIYIADPAAELMMRYGADAPPEDTLKDMERLLKGSKNWMKGTNYGHD